MAIGSTSDTGWRVSEVKSTHTNGKEWEDVPGYVQLPQLEHTGTLATILAYQHSNLIGIQIIPNPSKTLKILEAILNETH